MNKFKFLLVTGMVFSLFAANLAFAQNTITLSQYQVNLTPGATATVNIFSNFGSGFYLAGNSNSNVVSAGISGNNLTIFGLNSGSSTISLCSLDNSACTNLSAVVSGNSNIVCPLYTNCSGTQISLSQTNVNLNVGQNLPVSIYSSNGINNFFISSNSNSNVISASISGSTLQLFGNTSGSATIVVANQLGGSATLFATVNGNLGTLMLNTNSVSINVGGSTSVFATNNFGTLFVSNSNPGIVQTSVSGNQINLFGLNSGSTSIVVTSSNTNQSATIFVSVNGSVLGATTYANGSLVNDNGTVYIIYKNLKSGFANRAAFNGLGYNWSNVVNASTVSQSNTGFVINSSTIAHPWGSWISVENLIYFVHDSGLIPIPSYDIFINNGGQASLVVPANINDFAKPILSQMTFGDSRLH